MAGDSTIKQYSAAWADFERACSAEGRSPLPASLDTVRWYLGLRAHQLTQTTLRKRLAAILYFHRESGLAPPELEETWNSEIEVAEAIKTLEDQGPEDLLGVLTPDQLQLIGEIDPSSLAGARDLAIVLLLVAFDLTREQCASLNVENIQTKDGVLRLKETETSNTSAPGSAGVYSMNQKLSPAMAVNNWVEKAKITSGPLFRSIDRHGNIRGGMTGRAVFNLVRKYADSAGLEGFTPMSLRRVYSK